MRKANQRDAKIWQVENRGVEQLEKLKEAREIAKRMKRLREKRGEAERRFVNTVFTFKKGISENIEENIHA